MTIALIAGIAALLVVSYIAYDRFCDNQKVLDWLWNGDAISLPPQDQWFHTPFMSLVLFLARPFGKKGYGETATLILLIVLMGSQN